MRKIKHVVGNEQKTPKPSNAKDGGTVLVQIAKPTMQINLFDHKTKHHSSLLALLLAS